MFTVPTTCSMPSIEMVGFIIIINIIIIITVLTTCSRPSIEMVAYIYIFIYVFLRVHFPDFNNVFS